MVAAAIEVFSGRAFANAKVPEGFIKGLNLDELIVDDDPERLLARLMGAPIPSTRW